MRGENHISTIYSERKEVRFIYRIMLLTLLLSVALYTNVSAQSNQQSSITKVNYLIQKADSLFPYDPQGSVLLLEEADSLSELIQYTKGIFSSNLILATTLKDNPLQSRNYLNKIRHLVEQVNDTMKTEFHLYYGYSLAGMGEKSNALKEYLIADSLAIKINFKPFQARVNDYFASLYFQDSEYEKAIPHIRKSSKTYRSLGIEHSYLNSVLNLGVLYEKTGNLDSAVHYLDLAQKLSSEIYDSNNVFSPYILYEYARVYLKKEEDAMSYSYMNKAFELLDSNSILSNDGILLYTLKAELSLRKKDSPEAINAYRKALSIADQIQSYDDKLSVSKELSELLIQENFNEEGLALLESYHALRDSLENASEMEQKERLKVLFEVNKKENENALLKKDIIIEQEKRKKSQILFYGIIVLLLITGILALVFYRQKQRNQTLRYLQLEQKLLRTQMDPHFVFNSLNGIQNFLLDNDTVQSVSYLSKFAKLMRGILESSRKELITVDEDVQLMTYYLEHQQLQNHGLFQFKVLVDESLEDEDFMIPPLLTQPFIENAVKHAFTNKNKDEQNHILLTYQEHLEGIKITISDNGKGIETIIDSHSESNPQHTSYAMQITKERLDNLNKLLRTNISLEVTNHDGTSVTFVIPNVAGN